MVVLSVVVPTYKEADHIVEFLTELERALHGLDYEIVTVDDNSPDGTHERIVDYGRSRPRVRPVLRTQEKGLATAVIEGLRQSQGEFVAVMDSDFQHPVEDVPRLLRTAQEKDSDLVIGSRYAPGGSQAGFRITRRVISWGAKTLAILALPPVRRFRVRDPQSGFFLVRRSVVHPHLLKPKGYKILLEILERTPLRNVVEVGYEFRNRRGGESKLGLETQWDYLQHLAVLAWSDRENQRFLKFVLVGATGVIVNLTALALLVDYFGWGYDRGVAWNDAANRLGVLAPIMAREAGIVWNFVWNDRLTFRHDRAHAVAGFVKRVFRFHVVSLWSALAYLAVYYPLVFVGVHYLIAAALGIAVGFLLNYVGNVRWTYARRQHHGGA